MELDAIFSKFTTRVRWNLREAKKVSKSVKMSQSYDSEVDNLNKCVKYSTENTIIRYELNKDFLRKILIEGKSLLKLSEVQLIEILNFEELNVVNLY